MDNQRTSLPDSSVENTPQIEQIERFDRVQRISHLVMLLSFTVLAVTGLPQKFPTSSISQSILNAFGGIESARQVHHVSAVILLIVSVLHIIDVLYRVVVLRTPITILPLLDDFRHLYQDILYYLGFRNTKAYYGRYNYAEKMEYFAVVWGIVIMGITGFIMWNPIVSSTWLPGQIIPAAKAAHGGEAILAVLALIVWHFYHVHIRKFNRSMFNGRISRSDMHEEHPAELKEIVSGQSWQRPPEELVRQRRRVFVPVASVITIVSGVLLYGFITLETTAITTVPRGETVEVFVPLTPTPKPTAVPTPTPMVAAGVSPESWKGKYEALFRNRCGTCHGITAVGGLSLATYQDALTGGNSGPGIVPDDPDASWIVQVQSAGQHPGQLTIDELDQVIDWILAGAPEQ